MRSAILSAILLLAGCITVDVPDAPADAQATPPEIATASASQSSTSTKAPPSSTTTTAAPSSSSTTTAANESVTPPGPTGPRDWGTIDNKQIRPGVNVGFCTSNFLFHLNHSRYFLGTAGHCFISQEFATPCAPPTTPLGAEVPIFHRDSGETTATLAYGSFHLMQDTKETDRSTCYANDFALLELPKESLDLVHPAMLYYGGPTSLLLAPMDAGSDVYLFGYSSLRTPGTNSIRQELTSPMSGTVANHDYDDWLTWSDLVGTIDGDSGSGLLGPNGEAQGALSMGLPYETGTSNLAFALEYMRQHLGWAPELVTWAEFRPDGIEPLRVMGEPVPP